MSKKNILCLIVGFCFFFFQKTIAQNIPRREFRCAAAISNIATTPLSNGLLAAHGARIDVFHIRTNINMRTFEQHTSNIAAIAAHPTLNRCVSTDVSGEIMAWNTNDLSSVVRYQKTASEPLLIRFAPEGDRFYVLLKNRTTLLEYNLNEPIPSNTYVISENIDANLEQKTGNIFFATSKMSVINFQLKENNLTLVKKWKGSKKGLLGIKYVSGKLYSFEEKKVSAWDENQKIIKTYESQDNLSDFAVDSNAKLVALGTSNGKISVLDAATKKVIFQNNESSAIRQIIFHPSEPLVIVRFDDGVVKSWILK
jgi:WD40 repeat protein